MVPALANQGMPNPTTDCDTITVELRDPLTPSLVTASSMAFLQTNGTSTLTYPGSLSGSYYIAVLHKNTLGSRNALETWSAFPVAVALIFNYDLTITASKAYGSNQLEIEPGIFAFYSGDIVVDENVDLLDLNIIETDINNFATGYLATDINGDGNVDLLDFPCIETNINHFVFSSHP